LGHNLIRNNGGVERILILLFSVVIITIIFVTILILAVPQTPIITMTYQKTAGGATSTYIFTVVGVVREDVKSSDITVRLEPSAGTITKSFSSSVRPGDYITIQGLTPNTSYTLTLIFTPRNEAAYQITITAA
jgi:hypothetical protein